MGNTFQQVVDWEEILSYIMTLYSAPDSFIITPNKHYYEIQDDKNVSTFTRFCEHHQNKIN